jgi:hypothetical protein
VRQHSPEPRRRRTRGSPPAGPVTWPLPEVEGAAPRFTRSRLRFVMSRVPMPVVTCPGPGGPVTFSPPTYVIRHVRGERAPGPARARAPGATRGPSPGRSRGRRAANRRDSERISASQSYTT